MVFQAESAEWVVFIDGVQIPFLSLQLSSAIDQVSSGTVTVEPDPVMSLLRPGSVVAVFCRDLYDGKVFSERTTELLDGFIYFGGGEVSSINNSINPQSRAQHIMFKSDLSYLERHSGFASGVGGNAFFGCIVGSHFLNPFEATSSAPAQDLLAFSILSDSFKGTADSTTLKNHRSAGSSGEDFGLKMTRLVSWLASHNGSLRAQAVRTRLVNKICGVDDRTLRELVQIAIGTKLFQGAQYEAGGASGSILDMIRALEARVGYRFTTIFAPAFPEDQPPAGSPILSSFPVGLDDVPDVTRFRISWYRNDYAFVPNLFYSPPPPCNLIFPDMIDGLNIVRVFDQEPTRSVVIDRTLDAGSGLVFVEAPGLVADLDQSLTPDKFWANFTERIIPTPTDGETPSSAWRSQTGTQSAVNILSIVSDDELERGIVVNWKQLDYEYMLAAARQLSMTDNNGDPVAFSLKNPDGSVNTEAISRLSALVGQDFSTITSSDEATLKSYLTYVQSWLKYHHQIARWKRPSSISLRGHRWIVPGFSCAIFTENQSYLAYVTSVEQVVDASGIHQTRVQLDHVRPINPLRTDLLHTVQATTNSVDRAIKQSQDLVSEAHAADVRTLSMLLDRAAQADSESAAIMTVLKRAESCAESCVGSTRTVAGAFTSVIDPDLATRFIERLKNPPVPSVENAKIALNEIRRFYFLQEQQLRAKKPAQGVVDSVAEKINAANITLAVEGSKIEALAAELENSSDFPTPPDFYNQDLIQLSAVDDHYQRLLGCQPFYTGSASVGVSTSAATSYEAYVSMLQIFARIFPSVSSALPNSQQLSSSFQSWDDIVSADLSPRPWQHSQFLRRSAMTLRQYLRTHGFAPELQEFLSDEPVPTRFYSMQPLPTIDAPAGLRAPDGTIYTWDDSVISRLVDELTSTGESVGDPLMKERRQQARSVFLTSGARQSLIISYSRKHFGSRGFSGE